MTLEEWLQAEGLSNGELARRLNMSRATIGRYVRGTRLPDTHALGVLAAVTAGCVRTEDWLFGDERYLDGLRVGMQVRASWWGDAE